MSAALGALVRVLLDGSAFENDHQLGIQRYVRRLVEELRGAVEFDLLLHKPPRAALPAAQRTIRLRGSGAQGNRLAPRRLVFRLQRALLGLRLRRYSSFHSCNYRCAPYQAIPQVVTVYDMCVATLPIAFGEPYRSNFLADQTRALSQASLIVCISRATASAVVANTPSLAEKVRVVYPGADHLGASSEPDLGGLELPSRFALFVGARYAYKNFNLVLRGMRDPNWPEDLPLVVSGRAFDSTEADLMGSLGLDGSVLHIGGVSDSSLTVLYERASCFIFPSRCEGFGLPLLEAQRAGAPVACSEIPAFAEIAAGTAEFFDPDDPGALAAAVRNVCEPSRARDLRDKGQRNASRFTWAECGRQMLAVYKGLAADQSA